MPPNTVDTTWEYYGKNDPYYGVLTQEKFRRTSLDNGTREEFFESGVQYSYYIMEQVRSHLDPLFRPTHALDFGCGVGRITIPLASMCERVTGVDISPSMLAEAQRNCNEYHVTNANFILSDDTLSRLSGEFDFIHSYIVFQHIPCRRGIRILRHLLGRLQVGGVGVLHFTFHHPVRSSATIRYHLYRWILPLFLLRNLVKRQPLNTPLMQMNAYDLSQVFSVLHEQGCSECHTVFTDHGVIGAILIFRKLPNPPDKTRPISPP